MSSTGFVEKNSTVEKDIPVEYRQADTRLQRIAHLLVNYKYIKDIPSNIPLRDYLQRVADVVAVIFSFPHRGIGIGRVVDQVNLTYIARLTSLPIDLRPLSLNPDNDCKLPAAVIAYFVAAIAKQRGWPLISRCVTRANDPHVYVAVLVDAASSHLLPFSHHPNDYYGVHVDTDGRQGMPSAKPYQLSTFYQAQQGQTPYLFASQTLVEGLQLYDRRYQQAVAEQGEDPQDSILAACHYDLAMTENNRNARIIATVTAVFNRLTEPLRIIDRLEDTFTTIHVYGNNRDLDGMETGIKQAEALLLAKGYTFNDIMLYVSQKNHDSNFLGYFVGLLNLSADRRYR